MLGQHGLDSVDAHNARKWPTHDTVEVADKHGLKELAGFLRVSDVLKGLGRVLACEKEVVWSVSIRRVLIRAMNTERHAPRLAART